MQLETGINLVYFTFWRNGVTTTAFQRNYDGTHEFEKAMALLLATLVGVMAVKADTDAVRKAAAVKNFMVRLAIDEIVNNDLQMATNENIQCVAT